MEDVGSDIRPGFAEDVGEGIAAEGVSVFLRDRTGSSSLAGVVGDRNCLSDAPT